MVNSDFKVCPQCSEKNNSQFEKCWKCGFDFEKDSIKVEFSLPFASAPPSNSSKSPTIISAVSLFFLFILVGFAITVTAAHSFCEKILLIQKGVEVEGAVTSVEIDRNGPLYRPNFYQFTIQVLDPNGVAQIFENSSLTTNDYDINRTGIKNPGDKIPILYVPGTKTHRLFRKREDLK